MDQQLAVPLAAERRYLELLELRRSTKCLRFSID
jgi:hypothetical protein